MDSNGYWNLTQDDAYSVCEDHFNDSTSFNKCYDGAIEAKNNAKATEYRDYLKGGGDKSYKEYKKGKTTSALSSLGMSALHNLFGTNPATTSNTASAYQTQLQADEEKKKAKKKIIIGVSVAVVLIGTGIFIYYKMKK